MHGDPTLCPRDAEALDRSIVARLGKPGTSIELYEMMGKMRDTFSYKRFGFDTWEEYMVDRTAAYTILTVSRESLVWTLRDLGYTLEEIGTKLGISHTTARRDIAKKPQLERNVQTDGRTTGKDGKSYPKTKSRGKLTLVEDLEEDDDDFEDDGIIDVEVEEEEEDSTLFDPATARKHEKQSNPLTCNIEGWDRSYTMFSHHIDALLRNPTHLQAERLEKLLRRTLVRIDKLKQEIEQAHTERQAAQ